MQMMGEWVVDSNGDGYPDDVVARLVANPPAGHADRAFWSALIDHAARIGLETHALSMPLVVADTATLPGDAATVVFRDISDIPPVSVTADENATAAATHSTAPARCLTRLFTLDGALLDGDSDRLPDASRITFALPDDMPANLGAAVANLAARIGLESGGLTFPLTRNGGDGSVFEVRLGDADAAIRRTPSGWLADGSPDMLALLLDRVASTWPHVTAPETGGVGAALATLRRWLAGDGPEPNEPGGVIWQREWDATWEVDSVLQAISTMSLTGTKELTVFSSEPLAQRRELAERLSALLDEAGCPDARVTVLSAFKAGLSWLRDVVVPALDGLPVARVRIEYAPLHVDDVLDLPIRWLQELFPGNEVLSDSLGIPLDAVEMIEAGELETTFRLKAFDADGRTLLVEQLGLLSRIQPFVEAIPESGSVVVTTGGVIRIGEPGTREEVIVPTDLERFWAFWQSEVLPRLLRLIDEQGGPHATSQPFFGELLVEVWVSEPNDMLGVREENDSAAEALAEDIYFTTLDAIEMYGQRQTGERCNAPGAIVPLVHVTPGEAPRARVTLRAAPERSSLPYPDVWVDTIRLSGSVLALAVEVEIDGDDAATVSRLRHLASRPVPDGPSIAASVRVGSETAELRLPLPTLLAIRGSQPAGQGPPVDRNIHGEDVVAWTAGLSAFSEVTAWVEEQSYQGRSVVALSLSVPTPGRLHSPTKAAIFKPTYLIVARHHANEISSTNAALRLAWLCATDPGWRAYLDAVNVLILPYENPDGAALHARLASEPEARRWKHHPARFNALGYEYGEAMFDPDTGFGEARARRSIWERWPADVVVDNHGVPSHEWVQPFAGFGSPPRFKVSYWIVQALLYGIARWVDAPEYAEHCEAVMALRDAVSAKVRDTDIGEWNRVYGESYRTWGQSRLPDSFPGEFHDDMLWHISSGPADPEGRGFSTRYPKTTVLSWVTEVNDETAEGEHLERVARAHLLANQATLDLLYASVPQLRRWQIDHGNGTHTIRVGRDRPLRIGNARTS